MPSGSKRPAARRRPAPYPLHPEPVAEQVHFVDARVEEILARARPNTVPRHLRSDKAGRGAFTVLLGLTAVLAQLARELRTRKIYQAKRDWILGEIRRLRNVIIGEEEAGTMAANALVQILEASDTATKIDAVASRFDTRSPLYAGSLDAHRDRLNETLAAFQLRRGKRRSGERWKLASMLLREAGIADCTPDTLRRYHTAAGASRR